MFFSDVDMNSVFFSILFSISFSLAFFILFLFLSAMLLIFSPFPPIFFYFHWCCEKPRVVFYKIGNHVQQINKFIFSRWPIWVGGV